MESELPDRVPPGRVERGFTSRLAATVTSGVVISGTVMRKVTRCSRRPRPAARPPRSHRRRRACPGMAAGANAARTYGRSFATNPAPACTTNSLNSLRRLLPIVAPQLVRCSHCGTGESAAPAAKSISPRASTPHPG